VAERVRDVAAVGPPGRLSWWLREAIGDEEPAPTLVGEQSADVCIVGGGYTGLWTALAIKDLEPNHDVVVIEADLCGTGASGRNGGFAMTLWHQFLPLERVCGSAEAARLARASADTVRSIGTFCHEHGIEAGFRGDGWLWAATNQAQLGAWDATVAAIERQGEHPFERLTGGGAAARGGSPRHLGGVFEAGSATVQPALLARGLRRVALDRGVRVFERSPMISLERDRVLGVRTATGHVRGNRVVIAMNAWAGALRELRGGFVTVSSDLVITEAVPERLLALGLDDEITIADSRSMVQYYRPTADGRLAFGKGGGTLAFGGAIGGRFNGPSPRAAQVHAGLRMVYPGLADVPLAASWTGPIDRSLDGVPFVTALGRPDLVCAAGYSGNGVGPSALVGRVLASVALGREDEWSTCGLVRQPPRGLPPEPLRYVGGRIVKAAVGRAERAEDRGQRPSALDRRLIGLAPPGLVALP
jgi:putative aminophosphonate oxidoreductase